MAKFTVRIELFGNADEDDYENLHGKMQVKKYFRVIQGASGTWYPARESVMISRPVSWK